MIDIDAPTLARLIRSKEVSPVAVVDAVLARIEALQPTVNAFITVTADEARDTARRAEAAVMRGDRLGPLHGVLFSVKDLVFTGGVRTTMGSPFNLSGHPAVSLPCGWSSDGLSLGLQIVGPWYADRRVLALAAHLERERPCARPMPL